MKQCIICSEEVDNEQTLNAGGKSLTATPDEYREALATLEKRKQAASEQE